MACRMPISVLGMQAEWIARLQHASVPPSERKLAAYGKGEAVEESFTFNIVSYSPLQSVSKFPPPPSLSPSPATRSMLFQDSDERWHNVSAHIGLK